MKTKPLSLTLKACLLLLVTALCPEIAMSQQTAAQSAISETAAEYGIGRPRAESPEARQTPAPRSEGWWQAFERGWVYWHPRYRAHLVRGRIFETWGAQRWEQGPLGFPTRGESQCRVPDSRDRYQVFEGGRIYWRAATNEGIVFNNPTNFGEGGNCNPTPPPLDVTETTLSAPFTSTGSSGDLTRASAENGELELENDVRLAGSIQKLAFISQTLPVARGIRRVRVYARFGQVRYSLYGLSLPPTFGYSSAEAIVNLRVMDGSLVVCNERVSLRRLVTAVVGGGSTFDSRIPFELRCEFTRPQPDDATTYTLIAEIEGWAGVGGLSRATVIQEAQLRQFHVYLHRRQPGDLVGY